MYKKGRGNTSAALLPEESNYSGSETTGLFPRKSEILQLFLLPETGIISIAREVRVGVLDREGKKKQRRKSGTEQ